MATQNVVETATTAVSEKLQPLSEKFATQAYEAMVVMITKITSGVETAGEFLKGQLPDVLQQLIIYNLVVSLVAFFVGILIVTLSPLLFRKAWKFLSASYPERDSWNMDQKDIGIFCTILCVFAMAVGVLVISLNMGWLKIWLAPKIWLIEYTADLLKTIRGK